MALTSYLDVPMVIQEDDFSCVPCCIKMVLDFVRSQNPTGFIPDLSVYEIGRTIGTDQDGTVLDSVTEINSKLHKAVPSVEFVVNENCSFDEIEHEIQQGKPIISWIRITHSHSVVLTGLNKEALTMYYNDPEEGKKQVDMGKFISAWNDINNVLIKIKIGEKIQRIMPEYVDDNKGGENQ